MARWTFWRPLFTPIDISSVVFFRIIFGALMIWEMRHDFSPQWVKIYYVNPTFRFSYYGFDWIKPLPGDGIFYLISILTLLAFFIMVGFCYRISITLFFLGFTYIFLLDQTRYLNHFYFICLLSFLMIFIPAHRTFSVDSWLRPKLQADTSPSWTLWILRFQVGVVYFLGGIAKVDGDWLRGEPLRGWLSSRTDFPIIGHLFTEKFMPFFFSYSGLLIDLLIVPLLLWRRTRVFSFLIAVLFHLMNSRLWTIGVFPWLMIAGTILFFPSAWPRRLFLSLGMGVERLKPGSESSEEAPLLFPQKAMIFFLCTYIIVQILLPFRPFLYKGNVHWTEEGHRFSWHMMLRSKDGEVRFFLINLKENTKREVRIKSYLTPQQIGRMAGRPDMILQFSHYIAEILRKRGVSDFEVRANALVSLNGRKRQLLIDSKVDLASQPRNLKSAPWILPLMETLRH